MIHAILVIPQEYINVIEIETYSLRGILEWGKLFYMNVSNFMFVKLILSIHKKTLCERNIILTKYYPKITLFN